MGKLEQSLSQRFGDNKSKNKMRALAEKSSAGELNTFSGVFALSELSQNEKGALEELLLKFSNDESSVKSDLESLIQITAEVKAISNQAALLHGERIKRAQTLLKNYEEGAFTAWLLASYGNRQTPYNFLYYFDFYQAIPKTSRPVVESMPRQAVYTLASRNIPIKDKTEFVQTYQGETKDALLAKIRETYPLESEDKRRYDGGEHLIRNLEKVGRLLRNSKIRLRKAQKNKVRLLLEEIQTLWSHDGLFHLPKPP